jgi:4-hydroxy-tetrahydrodipicolinate reductase
MAAVDGGDEAPARAVLIGLGKLGLDVADGLVDRRDVTIVGAVDLDPDKEGRDLSELLGREPIGVAVTSEVTHDAASADIAVLMTASRMTQLVEPIQDLLERGLNVLTSAEELAYPWGEFPDQSRVLDAVARERGVTLVGAGANPGFLMDVLPVVLSLATQEVRRLRITRTMDLRPHRAARLSRFALGESPERFVDIPPAVAHGHIGFRQSIDAMADALDLPVDRVEEHRLHPAVVANAARSGDHVVIEPGAIAVVAQGASGFVGAEEVIRLEEYFGFLDDGDDVPRGDTYVLDGTDQRFTVAVRPGVLSFVTTPAVLSNLLVPVVRAEAGLRSTIDFVVRDLASKGRRRSAPEARSSAAPKPASA